LFPLNRAGLDNIAHFCVQFFLVFGLSKAVSLLRRLFLSSARKKSQPAAAICWPVIIHLTATCLPGRPHRNIFIFWRLLLFLWYAIKNDVQGSRGIV
jgi:hypothetical protein